MSVHGSITRLAVLAALLAVACLGAGARAPANGSGGNAGKGGEGAPAAGGTGGGGTDSAGVHDAAAGGADGLGDADEVASIDAAELACDARAVGSASACDASATPCLEQSRLSGEWSCSGAGLQSTWTIANGGDLSIASSNGQKSQGSIGCDGSFEATSTPDSGGNPMVFVAVNGKLSAVGNGHGDGLVEWDYCGQTTDKATCKAAPQGHSTQTCGTPAAGGPGAQDCADAGSQVCLAALVGRWNCSNQKVQPGYTFTYQITATGSMTSQDSQGQTTAGCIDCMGRYGAVSTQASFSAYGILDAATGLVLSNFCSAVSSVSSCRALKSNATASFWQCTRD